MNVRQHEKAIIFDFLIFLDQVPNCKFSLSSKEILLSNNENHIHVNLTYSQFVEILADLQWFLKDTFAINEKIHYFRFHEEINSREYHQEWMEKRSKFISSSYIPKEHYDRFMYEYQRLINIKE